MLGSRVCIISEEGDFELLYLNTTPLSHYSYPICLFISALCGFILPRSIGIKMERLMHLPNPERKQYSTHSVSYSSVYISLLKAGRDGDA